MTQTTISPADRKTPRMKRLGNYLWRAAAGAAIGGFLGWLLIKDGGFLGVGVGAVLGWYLARAIWGAIVGAVFGFIFVTAASGIAAGMAVGAMISCNIVGHKGRWIVLAVIVVIALIDVVTNQRLRSHILGWFGY